MERQSATIRFRLTEAEKRQVIEAAGREGKGLSEFVRDRLLHRGAVTRVRKAGPKRARARA